MKIKAVTSWRKLSNILLKPLTLQELKEQSNKDGVITAKLLVSLNTLINDDIDDLNDEVSERITGSSCLTDITYLPMGSVQEDIVLLVTGNVADYIEEESRY